MTLSSINGGSAGGGSPVTVTITDDDGRRPVNSSRGRLLVGGDGAAWSTAGGEWSHSGGVLRQTGTAGGDPKKALATGVATPAAAEVTARVRVDTWAGGDTARAGVSLGNDAAGRGYNLVFHADTGTVQFLHDGVAWGNRYTFAWQVGSSYRFRLRQEADGTLCGKVWADGRPSRPAGCSSSGAGRRGRVRRAERRRRRAPPPPASTTSPSPRSSALTSVTAVQLKLEGMKTPGADEQWRYFSGLVRSDGAQPRCPVVSHSIRTPLAA